MTTLDLSSLSIDQLDQITTLPELSQWTHGCTACSLRQQTTQVVHADGDIASPLLFMGMNPGFCEEGTGIPFCGRAELARSRCVSCTHYTQCYNWQTGQGARSKLVEHCLGYTPLPPGTPDFVPPQEVKVGPFTLGGVISAGQLFDQALLALGVDRRKIYISNSALCASQGNPKAQELLSCSRIRLRTQRLLKPKVIIALGLLAISQYSPRKLTLGKDHGIPFPYQDLEQTYQVVPTYHPSAILRKMMEYANASLHDRAQFLEDITKWKWALYADLGTAINLLSPPEIQRLLLPGHTIINGKLRLRNP